MFRSVALAVFAASVSLAQQPTPSRGSIGGIVVDAATLAPLENATVALTPATGMGAFPPSQSGSPLLSAARVATTARTGSYEFSNLPVGAYRLYIRRLGYEAATLDVELNSASAAQLSVGLTVVPVRLRAMRVQPTDTTLLKAIAAAPAFGVATSDARVEAARLRQRTFLGTDVREITQPDVAEAATLGGSDLLRALQRLPGVSSYDDWSAELWIRGSRWDQTRVYFDGLPFLNPLHAQGTVSGIGSDAIGAAILHPGVRPASVGGEGVAVLDLQSRAGGRSGKMRGAVGLSSTDLSLSLDQTTFGGRASWMFSARRSVDDVIPHIRMFVGSALAPASRFNEYVGRVDFDLGGGKRLEASALRTNDMLGVHSGSGFGPLEESGWGNNIKRLTLHLPFAGLVTSHTVGKSTFAAMTPQASLAVRSDTSGFPSAAANLRMGSVADLLMLSGEIRPRNTAEPTWAAGYSVVTEHAGFQAPSFLIEWDDLSEMDHNDDERLSYTTFWFDRRWRVGSRLALGGGMRVDAGGRYITPVVRYAPTLQARYALDAATALSVGVGRSHQYVQELPLLSSYRMQFNPGVWLVAGREAPFVQNDQANVGLERWSGGGVLFTANAYARRSTGIGAPDPRAGVATGRPFFVNAREFSHGLEFSARRLSGRITGSAAYSYGRATRNSEGLSFAAPGDRRHTFDATLLGRVGSFRIGGAFTAMSGLPYTQVKPGKIGVDPSGGEGAYVWTDPMSFGAPNARRFPNYASLDLMVDWTRTVRGASVTAFAQVPNVLGRSNLMWYLPTSTCQTSSGESPRQACVNGDLLINPVSRVPGLGIRVAF